MTIDETNLLHKKAESRKDGVYTYGMYKYAVKGNRFIAFADYSGNILHRAGSFNLVAGKVESYERTNALKEIIKAS